MFLFVKKDNIDLFMHNDSILRSIQNNRGTMDHLDIKLLNLVVHKVCWNSIVDWRTGIAPLITIWTTFLQRLVASPSDALPSDRHGCRNMKRADFSGRRA